MPGESVPPDPLYALARAVLLDVLEALGDQRDAVVLVGAQAIYLHTGGSIRLDCCPVTPRNAGRCWNSGPPDGSNFLLTNCTN